VSLLHANSRDFKISNVLEKLHVATRWAIRKSERVVIDIVREHFCKLQMVSFHPSARDTALAYLIAQRTKRVRRFYGDSESPIGTSKSEQHDSVDIRILPQDMLGDGMRFYPQQICS
jgi:hypothetical protein